LEMEVVLVASDFHTMGCVALLHGDWHSGSIVRSDLLAMAICRECCRPPKARERLSRSSR